MDTKRVVFILVFVLFLGCECQKKARERDAAQDIIEEKDVITKEDVSPRDVITEKKPEEPVSPSECGNKIIEQGEECEGENLNGKTCEDLGFKHGGWLRCDENCKFDTARCHECWPHPDDDSCPEEQKCNYLNKTYNKYIELETPLRCVPKGDDKSGEACTINWNEELQGEVDSCDKGLICQPIGVGADTYRCVSFCTVGKDECAGASCIPIFAALDLPGDLGYCLLQKNCNVFTSEGCPPGVSCQPFLYDATFCDPRNLIGHHGFGETIPSPITSDRCVPGAAVFSVGRLNRSLRCNKFCYLDPDRPCPEGIDCRCPEEEECVEAYIGNNIHGLCLPKEQHYCSVFTNKPCEEGWVCRPMAQENHTYCAGTHHEVGSRKIGEECDVENPCVPGSRCHQNRCRKYCLLEGDEPCPGDICKCQENEECQRFNQSIYGICLPSS